MRTFSLKGLSVGYGGIPILKDVSFDLGAGEAMCLLGPNGVGKTTLFKSMLGFLKPIAGHVEIDGEPIEGWSNRRLAQTVGYVPQSHTPPFAFPVIEVVTMGRMSHISAMGSPSQSDIDFAQSCLDRLGIGHLADKLYTQVSGGERQMVLIARALAQEPQILNMDEPTASLDYGNQVKVLRQIFRLTEEGLGVIMTTHFPDHAFLCATSVGLITREGVSFGAPDEVVTEESLRRTYGVDVRIIERHVEDVGLLKSCVPIVRAREADIGSVPQASL